MLARSMARLFALVTLSAGVVDLTGVAGCCSEVSGPPKPKLGDTCKKGTAACLDAKHELACQGGVYVSIACKGPDGCGERVGTVHCDITANETGDVCSTDDEGTGECTADRKQMVKCIGGKFRRDECDGAKGCIENTCYEKAKVGGACKRGVAECQDPQTELTCQAGKYIAVPCRGPKGCGETGGKQQCDVSGNLTGDPCSTDDEGAGQCGLDKKTLLKCEKGHFAVEACTGKRGCVSEGGNHTCYSL